MAEMAAAQHSTSMSLTRSLYCQHCMLDVCSPAAIQWQQRFTPILALLDVDVDSNGPVTFDRDSGWSATSTKAGQLYGGVRLMASRNRWLSHLVFDCCVVGRRTLICW